MATFIFSSQQLRFAMSREVGRNYMNRGKALQSLRAIVAHFVRAHGGVAAVEFAMIAPVMLLLLLGTFEVSQGIAAKRKVVLTASTVANIVTQYSSISASQQMPDILSAADTVLTPFASSNAVVTVSSINIDAQGKATIGWSKALNGSARAVGQAVTVPAALAVANTSLIFGETTYSYTPVVDFMKFGTSNLYSSVYMLPRSGTTITLGP
jgi:Flp pilus assembly protein TadG